MKRGILPPLLSVIDRATEASLRGMNPWWEGRPQRGIPAYRRWVFPTLLRRAKTGLAPAAVLRGTRQVGKSTIVAQVIDALLGDGVNPRSILHVQFDDLPELKRKRDSSPILDLVRWYAQDILGASLNEAAGQGRISYVILDEVQNLPNWSPQLKHLVDTNDVRVIVTGSSALRIEAGRDSLAGRIQTLEMGPLLLREIAELRGFGTLRPVLPDNGLAPLREKATWDQARVMGGDQVALRRRAFAAFSERGGYPAAQVRAEESWADVSDFLNETVIRRAIQHDLRMGPRGQKRDERLLEEVFRLCCRYVGQSPKIDAYLDEIRRALAAGIGAQRVLAYLKFLDGTLLVRLVEPLELRLKRRRGAAKICLSDHTLRAAWLREVVPLDPDEIERLPHLADLAGHVAESVAGYFLATIVGLDVNHFPERAAEPEVDFVLTIGEQRIPVEIKYQRRIRHQDTLGLRSFLDRPHYHAPFGVLVTMTDEVGTDDPRIVSLPLSSLLLLR